MCYSTSYVHVILPVSKVERERERERGSLTQPENSILMAGDRYHCIVSAAVQRPAIG